MADDPLIYIPTMWDDLAIVLWDPYVWLLIVGCVIGGALLIRRKVVKDAQRCAVLRENHTKNLIRSYKGGRV